MRRSIAVLATLLAAPALSAEPFCAASALPAPARAVPALLDPAALLGPGACAPVALHGAERGELVLVMDDLGYSLALAERVMALPGPVTLGLLPFAPATASIAARARARGREFILHQPMEPIPSRRVRHVPGTLTLDMSPERFEAQVDAALRAVPGAVGVNNHTGSRLTQDAPAMRRLMGRLAADDLVFLDSRTTAATVAYTVAREARVPALQRDVFLDHEPDAEAIEAAFRRALGIASRQGHAVIIAHPHDESLAFLEWALARLPGQFTLVSLRELAKRVHPAAPAPPGTPGYPHRSLGQ